MRRHLLIAASLLAFLSPAKAADSTVSAMTAASALGGTELLYAVQGGADRKATPLQMAAYVYGLMSGDATASGLGALTLATVNANVGTFGSATSCLTTTQNAKGLTTAISAVTCTPAIGSITGLGAGVQSALAAAMNSSTGPIGALTPTNGNCVVGNGSAWTSTTCPGGTAANPTATAGPTAVNGVATTYMRSDGAPAVQQGSSSVKGIVQVDGTTITATAGVISAVGGSGTVTSVGASCGNVAAPNPITTSGTIDAGIAIRTVSGTTDTVLAADCGNLVNYTNAGSVAVTLPQAGTTGFATRAFFQFCSQGAGTTTITPTTSTIGGAATKTLTGGTAAAPVCTGVISDGTNYQLVPAGGGGGGGTPGGSSGQVQYNNAGAFGGFTASGDATINTATGVVTTVGEHPGYVSGGWYGPFGGGFRWQSSGIPVSANQIICRMQIIPRLVTINALGAAVTTIGTTNAQFAIYTNTASNRPGTLIGNTGNIANTATGAVSGALVANKQIGPGGADGGKFVWFCINQGDSTAVWVIAAQDNFEQTAYIGDTTLSNIISSGANDAPQGYGCSGAACQGGSSTFGSWPANLTTSTWSLSKPSTTGDLMPVILFRAN